MVSTRILALSIIVAFCILTTYQNRNLIEKMYEGYNYGSTICRNTLSDIKTILPEGTSEIELAMINLPSSIVSKEESFMYFFSWGGQVPSFISHLELYYGSRDKVGKVIPYNIDIKYPVPPLRPSLLCGDVKRLTPEDFNSLSKRPNIKLLFYNQLTDHVQDVTGLSYEEFVASLNPQNNTNEH